MVANNNSKDIKTEKEKPPKDILEDKYGEMYTNAMPEAKPLKPSTKAKLFFGFIPFANTFLGLLNKCGITADKIAQAFVKSSATIKAGAGLQITSVIIAGFDFLTIPLAYLTYRLNGEKFPFTFSNAVKLFYSAGIFALSLTAILVPPLALPIALASTFIGLGSAVVSLCKHFYDKYKVNDQLKSINSKLEDNVAELDVIQNKIKAIEKPIPEDKVAEINNMYGLYEKLKKEQNEYLIKQKQLKWQEGKLSKGSLIDKSFSLSLSVLSLIGVVTMIFSPPVGLGIIGVVCASALAYVGGKIGSMIFKKNKSKKVTQLDTNQSDKESSSEENENDISYSEQNKNQKGSTPGIYLGLFEKENLADKINQSISHDEKIDKITNKLTDLMQKFKTDRKQQSALDFLLAISYELTKNIESSTEDNYTGEEVKEFLRDLKGFDFEVKQGLKNTLVEIANKDQIPDELMKKLEPLKIISEVKEILDTHKPTEASIITIDNEPNVVHQNDMTPK